MRRHAAGVAGIAQSINNHNNKYGDGDGDGDDDDERPPPQLLFSSEEPRLPDDNNNASMAALRQQPGRRAKGFSSNDDGSGTLQAGVPHALGGIGLAARAKELGLSSRAEMIDELEGLNEDEIDQLAHDGLVNEQVPVGGSWEPPSLLLSSASRSFSPSKFGVGLGDRMTEGSGRQNLTVNLTPQCRDRAAAGGDGRGRAAAWGLGLAERAGAVSPQGGTGGTRGTRGTGGTGGAAAATVAVATTPTTKKADGREFDMTTPKKSYIPRIDPPPQVFSNSGLMGIMMDDSSSGRMAWSASPQLTGEHQARRGSGMRRRVVSTLDPRAWLEVADVRHRYAKNLRTYYEAWDLLGKPNAAGAQATSPPPSPMAFPSLSSASSASSSSSSGGLDSFWRWLDGPPVEGKRPFELETCPRAVLEADTVHYCTEEEAETYAVRVRGGRFFCRRPERDPGPQVEASSSSFATAASSSAFSSSDADADAAAADEVPLSTGDEGWIFVLRNSTIYAAAKRTTAPRFHHSSFFAGACVEAAGVIVTDANGRLRRLYPHSGHYRPGDEHITHILRFLRDVAGVADLGSVEVDGQHTMKVARLLRREGNGRVKKKDRPHFLRGDALLSFLELKEWGSSSGLFDELQSRIQATTTSKRSSSSSSSEQQQQQQQQSIGGRASTPNHRNPRRCSEGCARDDLDGIHHSGGSSSGSNLVDHFQHRFSLSATDLPSSAGARMPSFDSDMEMDQLEGDALPGHQELGFQFDEIAMEDNLVVQLEQQEQKQQKRRQQKQQKRRQQQQEEEFDGGAGLRNDGLTAALAQSPADVVSCYLLGGDSDDSNTSDKGGGSGSGASGSSSSDGGNGSSESRSSDARADGDDGVGEQERSQPQPPTVVP